MLEPKFLTHCTAYQSSICIYIHVNVSETKSYGDYLTILTFNVL